MKILLATEFFPTGKDFKFTGGVEARTFFIAKYLAKNHQITILTTRLKGSKEQDRMFNFKIIRVGKSQDYRATATGILSRLSFVINAIKKSQEINADIVEGTNFITHLIAIWIGVKKKIPRVAWYPDVWIGSWLQNAGAVGLLGEIVERLNLKIGFSAYIAISRQTKNKLKKYVNGEINIIPCGVEPSEFKVKTKKQNTIICISRLAKYKNIKDLILAYALLKKQVEQLSLVIVGRGPQERELKDLAKNLKLKRAVKFLSNLSRKDLIRQLTASTIFCLPSEVEGFGIAIIEAAAAGIPYVVADTPVTRETTKNGQGGTFVSPGDIYGLSAKIKKLLISPRLYRQKVKEGLRLTQNYQWQGIAKKTEKIYTYLHTKNTQLRKNGMSKSER